MVQELYPPSDAVKVFNKDTLNGKRCTQILNLIRAIIDIQI